MNQSNTDVFSFCYDSGRKIVTDPDDEDAYLLSKDLYCDGQCERCDKLWGDEGK